jgi:hypothetical protein
MVYKKTLSVFAFICLSSLFISIYYYTIELNGLLGKAIGDIAIIALFPVGLVLLIEYAEHLRRSPKNIRKISKIWPFIIGLCLVIFFLYSGVMQWIAQAWLVLSKEFGRSLANETSLIATNRIIRFSALFLINFFQMIFMLLLPLVVGGVGMKLFFFFKNKPIVSD